MAQLVRPDTNAVLLSDLKLADRYFLRLKGLLGTPALGPEQGLWIGHCNSIHTFFMKFPIDCVFLDSKFKVASIVESVEPGKVVWPQWGASSVIEMAAGRSRSLNIRKGDQLHVGT